MVKLHFNPRSFQDAVRDMLFLKDSNAQLQRKLKQAIEWDMDVC